MIRRRLLLLFAAVVLLGGGGGFVEAAAQGGATPAATPAPAEEPFRLVAVLTPADWTRLAAGDATVGAGTPAAREGTLAGAALAEALRRGGLVIFVRHAATDRGGVDPVDTLGDCAAQRNLSAQGRAAAAAIGAAFRALGIPVGRIVASPFCRTVDTAMLAFGRAERADDLLGLLALTDPAERARRIDALRRLLATAPEPGTNTVLVGHASNLEAAAGVSLPEGGAAIFAPTSTGGTPVSIGALSTEY